MHDIHAVYERKVRDLPCFEFQTSVVVELYRIRCPNCGVKAEGNLQVPSKAPYSKRFEDAVGEACEGAAARQVARRMRLAESTVRAIDLRYLVRTLPCHEVVLSISPTAVRLRGRHANTGHRSSASPSPPV
jgi:transposase